MIKKLLIAAAMLCAYASAQVPVAPIVQPHVTFVNTSGGACYGCSLYSYSSGSTTPLATYTDATGTSQNTNPIILDAAGGANIWLGANSYKFVLVDPSGATIWSVDQVTTIGTLQLTPGQVTGTAIVQNPSGSQTITQPSGSLFSLIGNMTATGTYLSQFTGVYTSGAGVNHFQILEGGIDPSTEFNETNATFAETSSGYFGLVVPATSTTGQSAGVMGVVKSFSTGFITPAVGVYGSGHCMVTSCFAWGGNFLVTDEPGTFNNLLNGIELDVNIHSATTHGAGINIIGRWAAEPAGTDITFPAITVNKPVNFPGDTTGDYRWTTGLEFETGSILGVGAAVVLNPLSGGTSQRSQLMQWNSTNSIGTNLVYSSYLDTAGNLLFIPAGGGPSPGSGAFDSFNIDGSIGANFAGTGGTQVARYLQPTLATGQVVSLILGSAQTLNNSAVLQFSNVGGAGSANNVAALGVFGATAGNLTVDGGGNIAFNGTIKQGVGIQHKRGSVGCSTAASVGAFCTSSAQTWAVPFADTNYTMTCSVESTGGVPTVVTMAKTGISFTLSIGALTAAAASANYDCIAMYGTD